MRRFPRIGILFPITVKLRPQQNELPHPCRTFFDQHLYSRSIAETIPRIEGILEMVCRGIAGGHRHGNPTLGIMGRTLTQGAFCHHQGLPMGTQYTGSTQPSNTTPNDHIVHDPSLIHKNAISNYTRSKVKPGFQIAAGTYSSYVTRAIWKGIRSRFHFGMGIRCYR